MSLRGLLTVVGSLLLPSAVGAYDAWREFPQSFTTANLWSVAYGERTLVAVGEGGTILRHAYDDAVWLPGESGTRVWLVGVGYGQGRFVVVGDGGTILTSDDAGGSWTPRVSGVSIRLNAVVYGGGRWLAVGEQGAVVTSADGTTWTARPSLGSGFLRALAYGQGRFLIGGARGALFTTTDALNFVPVPISTTADIEGAAISDNTFWVVGSGGLRASATQLGTWSIPAGSTTETFRGVALRNTSEVAAVGNGVGEIFTVSVSDSGWRRAFSPPRFFATAVTQGLNEMVAVGFGGNISRSSMSTIDYIVASPDRFAVYGQDVRFSLLTGRTPTSYQWLRSGTDIAGATNADLLLPNVTLADAGVYSVRLNGNTSASGGSALVVVPAGRPELRDSTFRPAVPFMPTLVVPQPDGKVLISGSFSVTPSGGATYGLARLNADGSLDASFRAGSGISATSSIAAMHLLPDGRFYVRGSFTSIADQARPGLARLLPGGAIDPTFVPDAAFGFPTRLALASGGGVYVENSPTNGELPTVSRLTLGGARDVSFPLLARHRLIGSDSQGRVLAVRFMESNQVGDLVRYLANGTLDPNYRLSRVTSFQALTYGQEDLGSTLVTDNGLYAVASSWNRVGRTYRFVRYRPDGGMDDDSYQLPTISYPESGSLAFAHRPDGGLWLVRSTAEGTVAESYSPAGLLESTRYATLPDLSPYSIRAIEADGALLASNSTGGDRANVFVRIRPLLGEGSQLTNLSVRSFVPSSAEPLIVGFVTAGTGTTRALIRAVGPGLAPFGVTDRIADPFLDLTLNGTTTTTNDRWDASLAARFAAVGAFPLSIGSNDAALEAAIGTGDYTIVVTPAANSTPGTALAELYESPDLPRAPRRFINVSARGPAAPGRPLIAGFTIAGELPRRVLIRGVGPSLAGFGVNNALRDPRLTLHRSGGATLWENDDWSGSTAARDLVQAARSRVGAFELGAGTKDAATVVTLTPGGYTAVVSSGDNTTGTALIEIYEVP